MKKKLYLLFGLVMSLLLVGIVKAEGPYIKGWETEKLDNGEYAIYNTQYQNGYIIVDETYDGTLITIYDAKGNILKEKEFFSKYVTNILVDGDRLFFVEEEWANGRTQYYVREYNNKLEVQHELEVYDPLYDFYNSSYRFNSLMKIDGDLYYITFNSATGFLKLKEDLSSFEEFYGEEYEKHLPDYILRSISEQHDDWYIYTADLDGKRILIGGEMKLKIEGCVPSSPNASVNKDVDCEVPLLAYINNGKETVIELPEDVDQVLEVRFIDEYLVVIIENDDNEEHILVLDEEGKVVQDIEQENYVFGIEDTERGFIVNETSCTTRGATYTSEPSNTTAKSVLKEQQKFNKKCNEHHTVYAIIHEIKSEVTSGKGTIEVVNQETPGNPVTFVVTPDKGYTLGTIKVTDVNGNVITFTKDELKGNTFTMPSADVTIEVEFLVENAATADIAITLIVLLAILSAAVIIINKRKILEMK